MPENDKDLPENSKGNLDRKLDHAIEETFPTSDPVSVQITKGGAIDYDQQKGSSGSGGTAEGLMGQARETLAGVAEHASDIAGSATEMAREAYEQGRRYARTAAERYPQAGRYYEQSRRAVQQYTPDNPLLTLLFGAAVGYGIAWAIHHQDWRRDDDDDLPDYARTRARYRHRTSRWD